MRRRRFRNHNSITDRPVGAGAAGSSAAYHLQKFAKRDGVDINITIFEKSSYVGGRSTTVNAYDDPSYPVELGASIFVEINKILKNATTEFDLEIKVGSAGDEPETLGIWNGEKFVFTQKDGGWAWWDITKLIWKYGLAPIRTQRLVKATVGKFLKMYDPPFFPFRSLSNRAEDLELLPYTGVTGEQLLTANNVRNQAGLDESWRMLSL
jgi:prenylcysteine oxidase/farnesylcysteine lyase